MTTLTKKLGLKSGQKVLAINKPENYFILLGDLPKDIKWVQRGQPNSLDMIHLFVKSKEEFEDRYQHVKPLIKKDGSLWVSWPKGKSSISTDLKRDYIREYGINNGLVDVKVCSIDDDWSALKFVYRLTDR